MQAEQDWAVPFAQFAHFFPSQDLASLDETQMNAYLGQIDAIEQHRAKSIAVALSKMFAKP